MAYNYKRGNGVQFLNNIDTLEKLHQRITLPPSNQNRTEVLFSNGMGLNFPYSYIGKYFNGKKTTVWVGYYEPFGLCVSFLDKDKTSYVRQEIENAGYEYIGTNGYNNEGYWYSVLLSEAFKRYQNLQGTDIYEIANEIINEFDK